MPEKDVCLTQTQAASMIETTESTLATWRCRGGGPRFLKRNGRVFYRTSDIHAFLAARATQQTEGKAQ